MKVRFLPLDVEYEISPNQSVMNLAHEKNLPISSSCNGMPSCAECRVKVTEGEFNVLPPSSKELSLIGTGHFIDQRRLSCQLICFGDITVDLSEQLEKQNEAAQLGGPRYQGKYRVEGEESHAVAGIFIEQDEEMKKVQEEPQRPHRPKKRRRRKST